MLIKNPTMMMINAGFMEHVSQWNFLKFDQILSLRSILTSFAGDNYRDGDTYRMIERCFSGIVTTFLQHLKDYSERNSWLLKVTKIIINSES